MALGVHPGIVEEVREFAHDVMNVLRWINDHLEHMRRDQARENAAIHARRVAVGVTPAASTICTVPFTAVPPGFDWKCERLTLYSSGPTGVVTLYLDSVDPTNIVEVVGSGQLYSDAFANNLQIAENRTLIAVFAGTAPGQTCTAAIQIKAYAKGNNDAKVELTN